MAKCDILIFSNDNIIRTKKHGFIHSEINKLNNINLTDRNHVKIYNNLLKYRNQAKYNLDSLM